jgi:hypothetical protein
MSEPFDLNIDKVLPDWDITTAIREFIANAIDESILTNTQFPVITFENNLWVIRDYGRGIQREHLVINENPEKKNNPKIIGKFGYGLKDAAAVLRGNNIDFTIHSKFLFASFDLLSKHGTDIQALHAVFKTPDVHIGTEIRLSVDSQWIEKAKSYFLHFFPIDSLQDTKFGQVLNIPIGQPIPIYINGMRVAIREPDNLAFGYNITNLDKKIRDKLNRERMDLDWSIYSTQVVNILKQCKENDQIISTLRTRYNTGYRNGEVGLKDVRALFMGDNSTVQIAPNQVNSTLISYMRNSGIQYNILTQQDAKVVQQLQSEGVSVRDHVWVNQTLTEQNIGVISPIPESELTPQELEVLETHVSICQHLGYDLVRPIVNQTNLEWRGLQYASNIYVTRNCLISKAEFLGTYLHEMTHLQTRYPDATCEFESELTRLIGKLASILMQLRL